MSTTNPNPNIEYNTSQSPHQGIPVRGINKSYPQMVTQGRGGLNIPTQAKSGSINSISRLKQLQTGSSQEGIHGSIERLSNPSQHQPQINKASIEEPFTTQRNQVGSISKIEGAITDSSEIVPRKASEVKSATFDRQPVSTATGTSYKAPTEESIGKVGLEVFRRLAKSNGAVRFSGTGGLGGLQKIINDQNDSLSTSA